MNRKGYIDGFNYVLRKYAELAETTQRPVATANQAATTPAPKPMTLQEFQKQFDTRYQGFGVTGEVGDTTYTRALLDAYKNYWDNFGKAKTDTSMAGTHPKPLYYAEAPKGPSAKSLIDIGHVLNSLSEDNTQPQIQQIASNR